MSEVFFYGGIVLSAVFLALAIFLFFRNKIPSAISYFLRHENPKVVSYKKGGSPRHDSSNLPRRAVKDPGRDTEVLDIAMNYATALLDADRTELLPELDEKPRF